MARKIDVVSKVAVTGRGVIGAAPVWDITTRTLLWVERGGETVHRFDPTTGRDESLKLPQPVAAAHPRRSGGLVLTLRDGVALVDPDGTRRWLVYCARDGVFGTAATIDQAGRLWVATAGDGTLLRVEPDGAVCAVTHGMDISGMAFSPDATTLYLADVPAEQITAADFDPDSGEVGPRRPVCPLPGDAGAFCVDADGGLWVTPGTGTAVHRYRPDGTPDRHLSMGADATGCAFGGVGLSELYVTATPRPLDVAGSLLVIPDAGTGLPTPVFAG